MYFKVRLSGKSDAQKLDNEISRFGESKGLEVLPMESFSRGWTATLDSSIASMYLRLGHEAVFGRQPEFQEVHGGLELGIIAEKYPKLDCASMGPEILGAHTTEERLRVATVPPWYEWLKTSIQAYHSDSDRIRRNAERYGYSLGKLMWNALSRVNMYSGSSSHHHKMQYHRYDSQ
mmetsp:Transcript_26116/g.42032  ORF Transcript_26116/g.42032 Transcript_26116/m.42032 type:complete len:176 (+) Transcript_26116:1-528(+)